MQQIKFEQLINKTQQIEENCKCMICLEVFIDPICCENCESHYCSSCITTWSQNQPPRSCPICQKLKEKPAQRQNIITIRILKNMLNDLMIQCQYIKNGCNQVLKYSDYLNHANSCLYQLVKCQMVGCQEEMLQGDLDNHKVICQFRLEECQWCHKNLIFKDLIQHETSICELRCLPCDLCNLVFPYTELLYHQDNCPEKQINCYWCLNNMKKKDRDEHENQECLKIPIKCSGCQQVFQREQFLPHYEQCPFVELICEYCEKFIKRQDQQQHRLQQCFQTMRDVINKQQYEINKLSNEFNELKLIVLQLQMKKKKQKFSSLNKHQEISLLNGKMSAYISWENDSIKDRFVFIDNPDNKKVNLTFTALNNKFVAFGISDLTNLTVKKDYYKLWHHSYLFSSNGIVFISHSQEDNGKKREFQFQANHQLELQYQNNQFLKVTNLTTKQEYTVIIPQGPQLYFPVVCLRSAGDQVEIQNN